MSERRYRLTLVGLSASGWVWALAMILINR
jgi:hypothetical protein